jgi:GcrA cell cycle regulator
MTPADEARFIQLWTQGVDSAEIGRQLGIPRGTVSSRAKRLVAQGKIQPRPRGGAYPKQKALARQDGALPPADHPRTTREAPASPPAMTPAAPPAPTRDTPAITMVAVPELREIIHRFSALEARVAALEDGTRTPPAGTRAPGTIKQWTVRLSQPLIEAVKTQAAAEGKEPSHLVEELLWMALTDRRLSTP